ncbi:twitching motility protein PilT, partial [Candidatus Daviesbacteria bacterium]|nr:twitching motility protein PilT [Candidatus Daviesbacteria bacterium]
MRIKLVLRLILALIFATNTAIFSQLIPPFAGVDPFAIRVILTVAVGLLGFAVFPDVARYVRVIIMPLFNFVVHRLSTEVSSQLLKIPRPSLPFHPTPQVGSLALTKPLILDTSSIIDGRILDIAKTGFISGLILIPGFVLSELQQVADSSDDLKRQRARRGFEVIEELKKLKGVKVEVWDKDQSGKGVDEKLLGLGKSLHAKILTGDFNLNKVATVSGVGVLNVNELANDLKTTALPGETLKIKIIHVGKDPKQGIGYL